jgi:UDP-galactopyranose mutase
VRTNFDDRYFTDEYQALPQGGYTKMFKKILAHPNIKVVLNTDFFDIRNTISGYQKLFYTGPIDRFFDFKFSLDQELEYRSIKFVAETIDAPFYQPNSVINYPGTEVGFTRIIEYKHFGNQPSAKTTIVKEFTTAKGEPYYPVPNKRNRLIYKRYKREAEKLTDIYFVGRLANYKYFNMDEAFKNALELFKALEQPLEAAA